MTQQTYVLSDDHSEEEITCRPEDLISRMDKWARSYDRDEKTYWVRVRAVFDGEIVENRTYAIHPPEPHCEDVSHSWASPFEKVGGCEQNPGVFASGGRGVKIHEVCLTCGIRRITHTGAQDPVTGEGGMTSISYE